MGIGYKVQVNHATIINPERLSNKVGSSMCGGLVHDSHWEGEIDVRGGLEANRNGTRRDDMGEEEGIILNQGYFLLSCNICWRHR